MNDIRTLKDKLEQLKLKADSLGVGVIAGYLLDDSRFAIWSGSGYKGQHHYGIGGLLAHTAEVVELCKQIRSIFYPDVHETVLFLAALMHDWGKLWDYRPVDCTSHQPITPETEWEGTNHKREIHHISRSAVEFSRSVERSGSCTDIHDDILHAILAHQGQRIAGSPVSPNTRVAWLLYYCDGISARMTDCDTFDYLRHKGNR